MAWSTPKTNWVSTDYFNIADYNRMKNNIAYLNGYATKVQGSTVTLPSTIPSRTASSMLYASDMNALTTDITYINSLYAKETIGSFRTYEAVGKSMTYTELNQLEKAMLIIYNKYRKVTDFTLDTASLAWSVGGDITNSKISVSTVTPVTGVVASSKWAVTGDFTIVSRAAKYCTVAPKSTSAVTSGTLSCTINGVTKTVALEVRQDVTGVTLDKSILTVFKTRTAQLTATVLPSTAYNKNVTWTSSDESIATVDSNGVVTGVSNGIVTITATTAVGGYTASCSVGVVYKGIITGITMQYSLGGTMNTISENEVFQFENTGVSEVTFYAYTVPLQWQSYCKITFKDSAISGMDYSNFTITDNGDGTCTVKVGEYQMTEFTLTCTTDLGGSFSFNVGDTV